MIKVCVPNEPSISPSPVQFEIITVYTLNQQIHPEESTEQVSIHPIIILIIKWHKQWMTF